MKKILVLMIVFVFIAGIIPILPTLGVEAFAAGKEEKCEPPKPRPKPHPKPRPKPGPITNTAIASSEGPTVDIDRQVPDTPEPEFANAIQPVPSDKRPKNVLPIEVNESVREENLKKAFPKLLWFREAEEWLGGEDVTAIVKSPWRQKFQSPFAQWMNDIPENATKLATIYLYAGGKDVTTDGIMAGAFLHTMKSGRNGFAFLYLDYMKEPRGSTKGISLIGTNSSLTGAGKDIGYTGGFMAGWTETKLRELGFPQGIIIAFEKGCYEGSERDKDGKVVRKVICPEPPAPSAEKPKPSKEVSPSPPPAPTPMSAPAPVPKELKLPKFKSICFKLNSAKVENFLSGRVNFENTKSLQENAEKMKAEMLPLFKQYPDLRVLLPGFASSEGPEGKFRTKTKEGIVFDNNTLYNRGGLSPQRSNAVLSEILSVVGKEWKDRFIVDGVGWNENSKFPFDLSKVKGKLTKKELEELEGTLRRRVDCIPAFYRSETGYILSSGEVISVPKK